MSNYVYVFLTCLNMCILEIQDLFSLPLYDFVVVVNPSNLHYPSVVVISVLVLSGKPRW